MTKRHKVANAATITCALLALLVIAVPARSEDKYGDQDRTFSFKDFLTTGPWGALLKMLTRSNTTVSGEREADQIREHQEQMRTQEAVRPSPSAPEAQPPAQSEARANAGDRVQERITTATGDRIVEPPNVGRAGDPNVDRLVDFGNELGNAVDRMPHD
ncbi:hypothetical protein SAMN02982989_0250 [Xaviernesmea oryzae]|jgi:hypothetical protein|uniref:Secreted protein n=1 Tax=Xaviernesmea oryzae TaxID=464029 RepID=A0A1X7CG32_9HYPH|nr:hypothetical protein [Xaviernesmea oryzae]SME95757.1 hypothetical protein SAMN02982989_0250 [Xaviernesmea oryzae]